MTEIPTGNFTQRLPGCSESFDMIYLNGGTFTMGAAKGDSDAEVWNGEKIRHPVHVSPFLMGKFPVTQALYKVVMNGYNLSAFRGSNHPVENVSWFDAAVFCNCMNKLVGFSCFYFSDPDFRQPFGLTATGYELPNSGPVYVKHNNAGYRLPTEAEWEFAAKANSTFYFSGSDKLKEVGWFDLNSHHETKPVGLKLPNAAGIFDMSGNVEEWCQDIFNSNYFKICLKQSLVANPVGPAEGSPRVCRGGGWGNHHQDCRVSCRNYWYPDHRLDIIGFRLCLAFSSADAREQK